VGERGLAVNGEDDGFKFLDFGIVDESLLLKDEGCQRFRIVRKLVFLSINGMKWITVICSSLHISAFP